MKTNYLILILLLVASAGFASAQESMKDVSKLVGVWKVDLRPTPDAEGYFQEFEITSIDAKTFTGKFYGTEVQNRKVNVDWETVYLAFTSEDGSGVYHHTARVVGNRLIGTSHSIGRGFLQPWRADRKPKELIKSKK